MTLIAFLLRREGKQAKKTRQTVSIKIKEGAKYAAKKYLPPPSKMHGITFHFGLCRFLKD